MLIYAGLFAPTTGVSPGYRNNEGDQPHMERQWDEHHTYPLLRPPYELCNGLHQSMLIG